MSFMCLLGKHKWDSSKCSACGKTCGHDWSKNCEKCARCGVERKDSHNWAGVTCSICGKSRYPEITEGILRVIGEVAAVMRIFESKCRLDISHINSNEREGLHHDNPSLPKLLRTSCEAECKAKKISYGRRLNVTHPSVAGMSLLRL
jgi:hypothetical protein